MSAITAPRLDATGVVAIAAVAGLAVVAFLVYRSVKGAGKAVADAYSPGGAAYKAGDAVQNAIVPGPDSLGTWLYNATHPDYDPNAGQIGGIKPEERNSW